MMKALKGVIFLFVFSGFRIQSDEWRDRDTEKKKKKKAKCYGRHGYFF